jgi:hypothetical protein
MKGALMSQAKKIAVLGWGSLIWDPRNLAIRSEWFKDGPLLPIEFARKSKRGRVTLVITPEEDRARVRTLWALSTEPSLDGAIKSLQEREETCEDRIARWCGNAEKQRACQKEWVCQKEIEEWANRLGLNAVIWTALPPKWDETDAKNETVPNEDDVVEHLRRLRKTDHAGWNQAEQYVCRTPKQIDTPYRRRLEREFGWLPKGEA